MFLPYQPISTLLSFLVGLTLLMLSGCATNLSLKNITFNNQNQQLDIYLPKIKNKKTVIIFIHGGAFTSGDKKEMASFAAQFAQKGFVTANINYRLAPKHPYPAAVNDTKDALQWIKRNATKYDYSPNSIVLVGYSAGGTIALSAGLADLENVAAIVSIAGITDIDALLSKAPNDWLSPDLISYIGNKNPNKASPIHLVSTESPPVLLLHGNADSAVPISQSKVLSKKLKENNVAVKFRQFSKVGHEIILPINKQFNQLMETMTNFIMNIEAKAT